MSDRNNKPFELTSNTPRSSKTTINIAGFHVYLYGVDSLTPEQAHDTIVLFHIHGRTRTYTDAEAIAHELLFRFRKRGGTRKGLVVATFDNRNHGMRAACLHKSLRVSFLATDKVFSRSITWRCKTGKGEIPDMRMTALWDLSQLRTSDGIVLDIQIVQKHLATYVDGAFLPTEFIATGLSLGGHATWNILAEEPRITKAIIIVGSPNLTDLLLERLRGYTSTADVPDGTREWPRSIAKLYQDRDEAILKISGKSILILNGLTDTLVPSRFTRPWVEKYAASNQVEFIEQKENGHWLSYEMMDRIVDWLLPVLS
ncbi:uncharacterized protein Z518_10263 [Rhinocladiella mackenziei CBS 650.93]|uniref:Peptidase S9 prolyl oligopeptidase catalytic domain-containing protein n=1 Tax=Rhinocladiella mackenziei CBS 650.93 TaxID=1442369 RepID=A0A0D2IA53_9EURO|nr:uncharacterized protein Z518_10263 [Rhinocladiella mackenziei CBS 650.93]KIX00126.1 hypothetical protein Z518_10263 [Rhinocladiella mackenziei CBS 650.93]